LKVSKNNGATTGLIITQENGITALRSISLTEVSFEGGRAIVTLGGQSHASEFIKQHKPMFRSFITKRRDIIETVA
jgi:hypothetical protein